MPKTVLVIDNDAECRAIISHKLRQKRFNVIEASMLGNAMAVIREASIDLMIVDNRFPGQTAEKFIAGVRGQGNFFPIIFITGQFWTEPTKVGALTNTLKIDQVLRKPLDVDELIIGVQDFLGRRDTTGHFAVVTGEQSEEQRPSFQRTQSKEYRPSFKQAHSIDNEPATDPKVLRKRFRDQVIVRFEKLGQALSHAVNQPPAEHRMLLLGARLLAERLHGSSGTLGFNEQSRLAARIEEQIAVVLDRDGEVMPGATILQVVAMTDTAVKGLQNQPELGLDAAESGRGECVLLIEPDSAHAQLVQSVLRAGGLEPHRSDMGLGILRFLPQLKPMAVLTRLFMPRVNGFSIAKLLRRKWNPQIPLIGLTDRVGSDIRMAAYRAGFDDCILMPISSDELVARLVPRVRRFAELTSGAAE